MATRLLSPSLSQRILLALALVIACTLTGCHDWDEFNCTPGHPTDAAMIATWQAHRAEFDQLVAMFIADDKLEDVADDWMRPETLQEAGIDQARLDDYHRRFKQLSVNDGLRSYGDKDELWLIASACGLSVSGSAKGYLYLPNDGEVPDWGVVVDGDLDAYKPPDNESYDAFRPLGDGWYLYYSYED